MQTILVTGASGFIGKNFLKNLIKFFNFCLIEKRVKEKKKN